MQSINLRFNQETIRHPQFNNSLGQLSQQLRAQQILDETPEVDFSNGVVGLQLSINDTNREKLCKALNDSNFKQSVSREVRVDQPDHFDTERKVTTISGYTL